MCVFVQGPLDDLFPNIGPGPTVNETNVCHRRRPVQLRPQQNRSVNWMVCGEEAKEGVIFR